MKIVRKERKNQPVERKNDIINIIGAGLAGSEAAYQIAGRGVPVRLYEMRPHKMTPAHKTALCAELVCSNSLRAANIENAVGLLKQEMAELSSLVMEAAFDQRVPAGGALAVDRDGFAQFITDKLKMHPLIEFMNEEVQDIKESEAPLIIASGPLTSDTLADSIKKFVGEDYLHFYDAAAPLVAYESLDKNKVFFASRYDKGDSDYINCPMNKDEYKNFYNALINAQTAEVKNFEHKALFEGCMPIEEMARRGEDTMRFGPLKPVGLKDPRTGEEPWAVVQLRQDNVAGSVYNLVGFQTHLKWPEQKRVFGMIPGLENADFLRYGVMHRNTFINSPKILTNCFSMKNRPGVFFAGQITGVEGYAESAASGIIAGINAVRYLKNLEPVVFPENTALGSLSRYISNEALTNFQPMNINFGLLPPLGYKVRGKRNKNVEIAKRALQELCIFIEKEKKTVVLD